MSFCGTITQRQRDREATALQASILLQTLNAMPPDWWDSIKKAKRGNKVKLFEYAVVLHPEEGEKGKSDLIVDVTRVLASDQNAATLLAARAIPEEYVDDLTRVEVIVRPF